MKIGQTVYTANAKTKKADSWIYSGKCHTVTEDLMYLVNGKKYCFLPERCVFESKEKALEVLKR